MDNERLHYGDKIIYMEGVIVDVDDCSISIDLKGRLGFFKAPKRMFICDTEPKVGQEVGWNMATCGHVRASATMHANVQTISKNATTARTSIKAEARETCPIVRSVKNKSYTASPPSTS